jgi:hypothetical protein
LALANFRSLKYKLNTCLKSSKSYFVLSNSAYTLFIACNAVLKLFNSVSRL